MLTFLIMAGGSGERFWPLSTKEKPKQLLKVFSDKSLIRLTYERVLPLVDKSQIFIATNEIQVEALKSDLTELDDENIIIEPMFKDTAAAILYGSTIINKYFKNPTICVLASDHLINDADEFRRVLLIAAEEAHKGSIVTLGITPTYPETGYGYIEVENNTINVPTKSLGFKEKPSIEVASSYFASKKYLWNSGMFIFEYKTIMEAAMRYAKSHYDVVNQINHVVTKNDGINTSLQVKKYFNEFEKKSIDYAIMEHADNLMVIPVSFGWNDVGSYHAFNDLFIPDESGNVVIGTKNITVDSNDNIIIGSDLNLRVSLLGIHNQIIVYTKTDILVCDKKRCQDIKSLIKKL